jgi:hypothetical protein
MKSALLKAGPVVCHHRERGEFPSRAVETVLQQGLAGESLRLGDGQLE